MTLAQRMQVARGIVPTGPSLHRSMIGRLTVAATAPYIVYGRVRGMVSEHRTLAGARRSQQRDADECGRTGRGAYSDARTYEWIEDDWRRPVPAATYAADDHEESGQ